MRRARANPAADAIERRPDGLSFLFDLFAANQRIRSLLADAFSSCSLRPDEYAVYSVLFDSGPLTSAHMAEACGMPPTTVATYVKEMRARGHVERASNEADRRSYLLSLTASGRLAHAEASRAFAEAEQGMRAALETSEADVRRVLRALELAAASARARLAESATAHAG